MALVPATAEQAVMHMRLRAQGMHVARSSTLPVNQQMRVHLAALTLDSYIPINGQPQPDSGLGIAAIATCYVDNTGVTCGQLLPPGAPPTDILPPPIPPADGTATSTGIVIKPPSTTVYTQPKGTPPPPPGVPVNKVVLPPGTGKPGAQNANATVPPKSSNPGSDYRFLAQPGDVVGTTWGAHKGTRLFPKLTLVTRPGYPGDPKYDPSYYYIQHHPTEHINAPAVQLNGHGYLQVTTGSATNALRTHASMLMCFVPHHGPGAFYPIYSSKRQNQPGNLKRIEFRYVKGHIWLYLGDKVYKKIPMSLQHGEPCLFGWSWNGTTATVYVWDRNKYQFSMNTKGTYHWDLNGEIGAGPTTQGGNTTDWTNIADMDILEINMWETALADRDYHTALAHLAHLYGVGRS